MIAIAKRDRDKSLVHTRQEQTTNRRLANSINRDISLFFRFDGDDSLFGRTFAEEVHRVVYARHHITALLF